MMDYRSMTPEELAALLQELKQPAFRAKQLFSWLSRGAVLAEMSNLPKVLREQLGDLGYVFRPEIARKQASKEDGTVKALLEGKNIIKEIFVPGRLVNLVVK